MIKLTTYLESKEKVLKEYKPFTKNNRFKGLTQTEINTLHRNINATAYNSGALPSQYYHNNTNPFGSWSSSWMANEAAVMGIKTNTEQVRRRWMVYPSRNSYRPWQGQWVTPSQATTAQIHSFAIINRLTDLGNFHNSCQIQTDGSDASDVYLINGMAILEPSWIFLADTINCTPIPSYGNPYYKMVHPNHWGNTRIQWFKTDRTGRNLLIRGNDWTW